MWQHQTFSIFKITSRRERAQFIDFPYKLYNQFLPNNQWVPPLKMATKEILDTSRNPFFKEGGKCDLFLVTAQEQPHEVIARFAISWVPSFVRKWTKKTAFFGFYEQIEDIELARCVFSFARSFAQKTYNAEEIVGPINLSNNYQAGMLLDHFDELPFLETAYNPPYYPQMMETSGVWEKAMDLFSFEMSRNTPINPKMQRVIERLKKKYDIVIRPMDFSKHFKRDQELIRQIYEDAWSNNWYFTPVSKAEWSFICKDFKKIALPDFAYIGLINGEPFGFSVALPDINMILRGIPNGRLFPTGIFKLLTQTKRITRVRLLAMGVKQRYQHLGLGSLFYVKSLETGLRLGFDGELSWVLESNLALLNVLEMVGARKHKTYRIYRSRLNGTHPTNNTTN